MTKRETEIILENIKNIMTNYKACEYFYEDHKIELYAVCSIAKQLKIDEKTIIKTLNNVILYNNPYLLERWEQFNTWINEKHQTEKYLLVRKNFIDIIEDELDYLENSDSKKRIFNDFKELLNKKNIITDFEYIHF